MQDTVSAIKRAGMVERAETIACGDGRSRSLNPAFVRWLMGIRPSGTPARVHGNAIVPQVAAAFIAAAQDVIRAIDLEPPLEGLEDAP